MELKIAIEGIEMVSFEMKPRSMDIHAEHYHIDVIVQITPVPPKNMALARVNIVVRKLDGQEEFAKLSVIVAYRIDNFAEVFHIEDDSYTIPKEVNSFISSISISTTRGILFTLLRGTYLHSAILPIVDMNSLKDISSNFNSEHKEEATV